MADLVALGVEEHDGPDGGSGEKRKEKLGGRHVVHASPTYYASGTGDMILS